MLAGYAPHRHGLGQGSAQITLRRQLLPLPRNRPCGKGVECRRSYLSTGELWGLLKF